MVAKGIPIQKQTPDYSFGEQLSPTDPSVRNANSHLWVTMETTAVAQPYGLELSNAHTSPALSQSPSPHLQGSLQCYARRVSEPVQPVDVMELPYGRYSGPYSRASSTLTCPSPMTPSTDDMIDQWASRRRPSDFATSAAPSSFSPKSPIDYDFPTGTHLPPLMNGSHESTTCADISSEGLYTHQASSLFDRGQLTLDITSSCAPMDGPPYPPQILDQNGDIFPKPYLDPHVLNMAMSEEEFTTPDGLLNMEYGVELQDPGAHDSPHGAPLPLPEDDLFTTRDHGDMYEGQHSLEEVQAPPHSAGIQRPEPRDRQTNQQSESSQNPFARQLSHQVRSSPKASNQCSTCNKVHDSQTKLRKHIRKEHVRPYPCIFTRYGCNSIFGTKNEWSPPRQSPASPLGNLEVQH